MLCCCHRPLFVFYVRCWAHPVQVLSSSEVFFFFFFCCLIFWSEFDWLIDFFFPSNYYYFLLSSGLPSAICSRWRGLPILSVESARKVSGESWKNPGRILEESWKNPEWVSRERESPREPFRNNRVGSFDQHLKGFSYERWKHFRWGGGGTRKETASKTNSYKIQKRSLKSWGDINVMNVQSPTIRSSRSWKTFQESGGILPFPLDAEGRMARTSLPSIPASILGMGMATIDWLSTQTCLYRFDGDKEEESNEAYFTGDGAPAENDIAPAQNLSFCFDGNHSHSSPPFCQNKDLAPSHTHTLTHTHTEMHTINNEITQKKSNQVEQ